MSWCYLIIDSRILKDIIDTIGTCPKCSSKVCFDHNVDDRRGLSHLLKLSCSNCKCKWHKTFWTSNEVDNTVAVDRGRKRCEINTRAIIAFREIGKSFESMKTLCGFLNIPPPMTQKSFSELQSNYIIPAFNVAARSNMENAAAELRGGSDDVTNITISTDGTWQRRGFSSLIGVVSIIANETGKCIDYRVLTKNCHACKLWKGKTGTKYENFLKNHKCPINHQGASGTMEMNGVMDCFKASVETRKLRYLTYIGDGDSKGFLNVVACNPYPGFTIKKSECVGHIQKRCGKKLLQFKNESKELMPTDYYEGKKDKRQKKLSFYLTHKFINRLQNYYGIAIRSNANKTVNEMRKAIGAVLFHCSEAGDLASRHQYCLRSADSWCKYMVDQVMESNNYVEKPGLPVPLRKALEPIFRALSSPDLLTRCLEGNTQNNNESINGVIWTRCSKNTLVSGPVLEMSVCSAVICFNSGRRGIYDVFTNCGLETGPFMEMYCNMEDKSRVIKANFKATAVAKKRRKTLRAVKKGFMDKESLEDVTYASGSF